MIRVAAALLFALAFAACTGATTQVSTPPPGDAGEAGLAGDLGFIVSTATEVHSVDEFGFVVGYGFALSTLGFTCNQLEALDGGMPAGPYQEVIGGIGCASGCGPPPVGTYSIAPAGAANQEIAFVHVIQNIDGGAMGGLDALSGTVTFTYATSGQIAGSFDAEFALPMTGNPSELQGTFNVVYCP